MRDENESNFLSANIFLHHSQDLFFHALKKIRIQVASFYSEEALMLLLFIHACVMLTDDCQVDEGIPRWRRLKVDATTVNAGLNRAYVLNEQSGSIALHAEMRPRAEPGLGIAPLFPRSRPRVITAK